MTAEFQHRCRYHGGTNRGIASVALLPLNDVRELNCAAGRCVTWTRRPKVLRHSEGYASTPWNPLRRGRAVRQWTRESCVFFRHPREAGIPHAGATQYVIVTFQQPTVGLRRRKVRSAPLPPYGESFSRSLAPPFRPQSASPGSRPRRGQRSARMTADNKLLSF